MVERKFHGPNLIVVPTSVLPNWEREAEKIRARPEAPDNLWHAPRQHVQAYREIRSRHHHLRPFARDPEEMEKHEFNTVIR